MWAKSLKGVFFFLVGAVSISEFVASPWNGNGRRNAMVAMWAFNKATTPYTI